MAPKFALFTKESKLPLNKGFKNVFELLQSCAQPSIWASPSKKVPSDICKIYRFRLSCACAKYKPSLCSPFIHSAVSNESVSRLYGCLRCSYTHEDTFLYSVVHMMHNAKKAIMPYADNTASDQ